MRKSDPFEHPLLPQWLGVLSRCYNPKAQAYLHYGGRGIRVCRRWHRFEAFAADMGPRPSRGHSIDRKNVDGDYGPKNCRWATTTEQGRNKRNTVLYTIDGVTRCLPEWAELAGLSSITVRGRLRRGWPIELAVSTPATRPSGEKRVLAPRFSKMCADAGVAKSTYFERRKRGWSHENALHTPSRQGRRVNPAVP